MDNVAISRERLGCLHKKYSFTFTFYVFLQRKPSIIASTKHQQIVKTFRSSTSHKYQLTIGVILLAIKISNSKIILGKHKI
jgi:hypothetical protein